MTKELRTEKTRKSHLPPLKTLYTATGVIEFYPVRYAIAPIDVALKLLQETARRILYPQYISGMPFVNELNERTLSEAFHHYEECILSSVFTATGNDLVALLRKACAHVITHCDATGLESIFTSILQSAWPFCDEITAITGLRIWDDHVRNGCFAEHHRAVMANANDRTITLLSPGNLKYLEIDTISLSLVGKPLTGNSASYRISEPLSGSIVDSNSSGGMGEPGSMPGSRDSNSYGQPNDIGANLGGIGAAGNMPGDRGNNAGGVPADITGASSVIGGPGNMPGGHGSTPYGKPNDIGGYGVPGNGRAGIIRGVFKKLDRAMDETDRQIAQGETRKGWGMAIMGLGGVLISTKSLPGIAAGGVLVLIGGVVYQSGGDQVEKASAEKSKGSSAETNSSTNQVINAEDVWIVDEKPKSKKLPPDIYYPSNLAVQQIDSFGAVGDGLSSLIIQVGHSTYQLGNYQLSR